MHFCVDCVHLQPILLHFLFLPSYLLQSSVDIADLHLPSNILNPQSFVRWHFCFLLIFAHIKSIPIVGSAVGLVSDKSEGDNDGSKEGKFDETVEGLKEGLFDGNNEGSLEGLVDEEAVGFREGKIDGCEVGWNDGLAEKVMIGFSVGRLDGADEGLLEGSFDEIMVGLSVGPCDGMYEGWLEP